MKLKRRELVVGAAALGLGSALGSSTLLAREQKRMKILILGGTGFIGPHLVREAIARGHDVTIFNRGRSNTHLFPQVKKLVGDRDGALDALKKGEWDAVLDNSGYVPRHVKDSAQLLKGRVGRYLFTSTISVFDLENPEFPLGVGSRLQKLSEPGSEDVNKHYGALKVLCEQHVNELYGADATIVRPTYVVGPGDHTQRFTWWVVRTNRGGDMLAPGNPQSAATFIDVRDLAEFSLHLLEHDTSGTYNAAGPAGVMSFGGMLAGIRATGNVPLRFHWMDAEFLAKHEVGDSELPMWMGMDNPSGGALVENQSSIDKGLGFRSLAQTASDTLDWHLSLPAQRQEFTRAGLDPAKEKKVLAAWMARGAAG
jgi:2'-hydroxyisoflavone reductase